MFLQQLVNGLTLGSLYAVLAIGLTLVFGVLNIINMAHGGIFMIGAFVGLFMVTVFDVNIFVALIVAMAVGAILGYLLEFVALRPLRKKKVSHLAPLISTIGVSIFLESLALLLLGPSNKIFPTRLYWWSNRLWSFQNFHGTNYWFRCFCSSNADSKYSY